VILLASLEEAIQRVERSDRPAKMCELCLDRLADNVFTYEFDDGEVLVAEICWLCSDGEDEQIAVKIISAMIFHNDVTIETIKWWLDS